MVSPVRGAETNHPSYTPVLSPSKIPDRHVYSVCSTVHALHDISQLLSHFISERSLYAIARPSVCRLSVTFVRPTQTVQIFGNISTALTTLATLDMH